MSRDVRSEMATVDDSTFRLLVEAITDYAIYMLDAGGSVVSWNPGAERIMGYDVDEAIGRHFAQFFPEADRTAGLPEQALATAAREGRFEQKGWRVRKDGSQPWVHVIIDPVRDASGGVIGFAEIVRDLSTGKAAEDALRQSERQFKILVEGVSDYAIYMLDTEGRISSWNLGAERIKGYRPDEIIGDHFSRFYTPEDRDGGEPQRALETAARDGKYEKEGWRVRKDGSRFLANVVVDPIHDDEGTLIGFAKITRDVTEQREAQRALERAQEALFQSQKMEALGQLTGGIAHDFNNILMAISSGLELLRRRIVNDPRAISLVDNAAQAAERGGALTQRMLAFARRQKLELEPVDVPALITGIVPLLEQSIGPSVAIELDLPVALDAVQVDANQLELALLNLAVNARDAMPDGGKIVIAARRHELASPNESGLPPGGYVCLALADNGEGMDAKTLERAREPFFTTKGIGKGTGLGLSMIHGLAEQSGGRLMLRSRKGEGTVAEIWLPIASDPPVQGDRIHRTTAVRDGRDVRPLTILVVDDDPIILRNTAAMLEDLGHGVIEANSGREALALFRYKTRLDLVVTDQGMPEMTGLQLADAIRAEAPDLPIILATGYAELEPESVTNLPRLSKPFRQHELARCIEDVIGPA